MDDIDLIDGILQGNEKAFYTLYQRYGKDVWRFVMCYVSQPDLGLEITDDVFLEVWKSASRYKGRGTVKSWILGIARHKALDALKKGKKNEVVLPDNPNLPSSDNPLSHALRKEKMDAVEQALLALSEEHRVVILLAFVSGLTYKEIAHTLGCPENTVKSRIHYARKHLQKYLEEQYDGS